MEVTAGREIMPDTNSNGAQHDLSKKRASFMFGWGIPILVLVSVNFLEAYVSARPIILMMSGAYIWMGAGCIINAMRCGRLHCYVSGPTMLIGGLLILLVGFNIISLGPIRVMHISYATILIVALSFLPEIFAGSYGEKMKSR